MGQHRGAVRALDELRGRLGGLRHRRHVTRAARQPPLLRGGRPLGVGLWVNDPGRLGSLVSDTNWVCARDASSRHFAWAGHRTDLAGWRTSSGQDARSLTSWAPQFDAQQRVTSTNWGLARGDDLGLLEDFAGTPLPAGARVDIGAFQAA